MAVQNLFRRAGPYLGSGSLTSYSFKFKVYDAGDVKVSLSASAEPYASDVELAADQYTVRLNSDQETNPGGSVLLAVAPDAGIRIAVWSDAPAVQTMVLQNHGGFLPATLNDAADRSVILSQDLQEEMSRAITIPRTSTSTAEEFTETLLGASDSAAASAAAAAKSAEAAKQAAAEVDSKAESLIQTGAEQIAAVRAEGAAQTQNVQAAGDQAVADIGEAAEEAVTHVQSAVDGIVDEVTAEGNAQKEQLREAASDQIKRVESAGAAQVTSVQSAGSAQIALVEAAGKAQADGLQVFVDAARASADAAAESETAASASASTASTEAANTRLLAAEVQSQVKSAMFSWRRYAGTLSASGSGHVADVRPSANLKAGDTLVDGAGAVFAVEQLDETTFTVGEKIASLVGPTGAEGEQGPRGLQGPEGPSGQSYQPTYTGTAADRSQHDDAAKNSSFLETDTGKLYFKLSDTAGDWSEGIEFGRGPKGEAGQSANEILMDPDPREYFIRIYGKTSGGSIGDLVIEQPPLTPDPVETYKKALAD